MHLSKQKFITTSLQRILLLIAPLCFFAPQVFAQDLQAELDALDDLPEEDLFGASPNSGGSGNAASTAAPRSSGAQASEELLLEDNSALRSGARGSSARGTDDPDLDGLEQELRFDDYQDGNALSLEQLNDDPSLKASTIDGPMGTMTALDFKQMGDRVRIVMGANRPIDWTRELRGKRRQVVVELRNMRIGNKILKRPLDTGEFEGPVALIQAFDSTSANIPTVKVLIQLRNFVDPTILRTGNQIVVDFPLISNDSLFRSSRASKAVVPKTYLSMHDIKEFTGGLIDLNAKETPLAEIMAFVLRPQGINYLFKDNSAATAVTVSLTKVPWDQALATILFNANLGYQVIDKVYYIANRQTLTTEIQQLAQAQEQSRTLIPTETRLMPVAYQDPTVILGQLASFRSPAPRGDVKVDLPSNTLIVTDIPENLDKMERLIRVLDRQPAQILIEGRLVSMQKSYGRTVGVSWNLGAFSQGNFTGNIAVGSTAPSAAVTQAPAGNAGNMVIPVRLGNAGPFGAVSALLSLASTRRMARTITSPRVITQNQVSATISSSTPIEQSAGQTVNGTAATTTVQLPTNMSVTPTVKADGFIDMQISITKANAQQGTDTVNARMLVEDGKTAVVGGLNSTDESLLEEQIPFFSSLPIFGRLFTGNMAKAEGANELVAFISPKILNPNESRGYAWDSLQKARRGESSAADAMSVFGEKDESAELEL